MNHHLRFSGKSVRTGAPTIAALTLAAGLLTSCSNSNDPILSPPKPHTVSERPTMVKFENYLFTTPEGYMAPTNDDLKPEIRIHSAEEGEKLVRKLQRHRRCQALPNPSVIMVPNRSATVELIREFVYATEYDPPKFPKDAERLDGGIPDGSVFPVTPATPTSFETKMLGIKATYNVRRLKPDAVDLDLKVNRNMFLGFVNYGTPITAPAKNAFGRPVDVVITENKILMPVFNSSQANTRLTVKPGDYIEIRGLNPRGIPETDQPFEPAPKVDDAGGAEHMVALIRVLPLDPKGAEQGR